MEAFIAIMIYTLNIFPYAMCMHAFYGKRRTTLPVFIITGLIFSNPMIIPFTLYTFTGIRTFHFLVWILGLFIVSLNYKATLVKRIVSTIIMYTMFLTAEIVVNGMFIIANPQFYQLDYMIYIFSGAMILTYSVVALLLLQFKNLKRTVVGLPLFWVAVSIIPVSSTVLVRMVIITMEAPIYIIFIIHVIILAINWLVLYLQDSLLAAHEAKLTSVLHSQEKEYYFAQCQLMQESADKVKAIRHDTKIHFAALKNFAMKINADDITGYLNKLIGEIEETETYSDTGNIAFDSIINYKLRTARLDNIKLDLDLLIPPALDIEVPDVITILGNLIDNALDAVTKVDEKMIKLTVRYSKGCLLIHIENTFNGEIKHSESQILSLKDGAEHGYGLKNIRKSIAAYDGRMDITHTENMYSAVVVLNLNVPQC